ncbi:MAG: hypothetical protein A2Y41_02750 [Spirochaetes bacterium GWB1_36_13]|nr:MAG: hypothetical protein A2Y41_02750 [Spirochaetes bacterium GWB1_36_13]
MKKSISLLAALCILFSLVFMEDIQGKTKKNKKEDKKTTQVEEKKEKAETPTSTADSKEDKSQIDKLRKEIEALLTADTLKGKKAEKAEKTELDQPKTEAVENKVENGVPITYVTTTQKFKASAAYDQQILLNPNSGVIYPGSVILGHTIDDGSYKEITEGEKRPITLSYDLTGIVPPKGKENQKTRVSGTIVPSSSNFNELHNSILSQNIEGRSSIYSFEEHTITDESEFGVMFNLGVGFSSPAVEVKVKTGFDFKKSTKKYKHMIKFMQTFYTVSVDQGNGVFLYKNFNLASFKGYRPVYVSSIAFGRIAYLTIESNEDLQTIMATLNVAVEAKANGQEYEADFKSTYDTFKKENKINITVIGGSVVATTLDGFMSMLQNDGFSAKNPGKNIAYQLRFVDDNTIANTIYSSEYTVRQTTAQKGDGVDVSFTLYKIKTNARDGNGKDLELYGSLDLNLGGKNQSLWNLTRDQNKKFKESGESAENKTITFSLPNDSAGFDAKLYLREADGSAAADDYFTDLIGNSNKNGVSAQTFSLSNYKDGQDLILKVHQMQKGKKKIENEWVEFYIRVNKNFKFPKVAGGYEEIPGLPFQPTRKVSILFSGVSGGSALPEVSMGNFVGTKGQSKPLEMLNFELKSGDIKFEYTAHIQDVGDTPWAAFSGGKGSVGRLGKRMEGIAFRLTPEYAAKYDIYYRGHVQNVGDTPWYKNGEYCGTKGKSLRMEGIQIIIKEK